MPAPPHTSVHTVANLHVRVPGDGGGCELASGVDALYLSGHGYVSKGFLARLEEERIFADRVSVPVPFQLGPLTLGLASHGWGKYRYCLDHETADRLHVQPPAAVGAHPAPGRVPPFSRARRSGATFRRPRATIR